MPGIIEFEYDEKLDIVTACPKWHIADDADCIAWFAEWERFLKKFGRKMDCVILLDDFIVESDIGAVWGEYRARLNREYIRYGYRVNPSLAVNLFVKTSGIRYNASTAEAPSREDAMAAILKARAKDGVQ